MLQSPTLLLFQSILSHEYPTTIELLSFMFHITTISTVPSGKFSHNELENPPIFNR